MCKVNSADWNTVDNYGAPDVDYDNVRGIRLPYDIGDGITMVSSRTLSNSEAHELGLIS